MERYLARIAFLAFNIKKSSKIDFKQEKTKRYKRSVILKELSTLLYETNIRLSNSGLMYNYIISKLFKLVDNGKPAYQAEAMDWTTTYEET